MTYYIDMQDGVPIRDITGLQFPADTAAIEHGKELARRFIHDPRRKDPIHSIVVLSESGAEIHREPLIANPPAPRRSSTQRCHHFRKDRMSRGLASCPFDSVSLTKEIGLSVTGPNLRTITPEPLELPSIGSCL
jgi:hypothetical protein